MNDAVMLRFASHVATRIDQNWANQGISWQLKRGRRSILATGSCRLLR